jgi:serine/threonine-protein kinase RsbW
VVLLKVDNMKEYSLTISSNTKLLVQVEELIEKITGELNISNDVIHSILIAVTESVNNAIIHGNKRNPQKQVKISCLAGEHELEIKIKDEGEGFKVENVPDPLLPENLTKDSGRGIFIIKSLIDSYAVHVLPDGTEVILKIHF